MALLESGFEHFCKFGYAEIIAGSREWARVTEEKKTVDDARSNRTY